jgi:PASTA domain
MSGIFPPNGQPSMPPNGQQPYPTNGPPRYQQGNQPPFPPGPPFPPNGRPLFSPDGQPPFMQGPPPQPRGNGFATAALVLGILALLFAFASAAALAVLLGALALTFGLISLRKRTGRGVAGTIMGSAGLVIAIAIGMVNFSSSDEPMDASEQIVAEPDDSSGDGTVPSVIGKTVDEARAELEKAGFEVASPGAGSDDEVSKQSPTAGTSAEAGSTVTLKATSPAGSSVTNPAKAGTKFGMVSWGRPGDDDPEYRIWFDGYAGNQPSTDSWDAPDTGMKYVTVVVHVEALQAGVHTGVETWDVNLTDKQGKVYEETYLSGVEDIPSVTLGKGQLSSGRIAFEVPNDFNGGVLSFADATIFVRTN